MRLLKSHIILSMAVGLFCPVKAGVFGGSSSTTAAAAQPSSSGGAGGVNEEVAFLRDLQTAQVSSMSCLIALVNMTVSPIGTCLGLTSLAPLIVAPSDNSSFSDQLNTYLGSVCGGTQCAVQDISDAKSQLDQNCSSSQGIDLVKVLGAILDNYTNSFRTLACSVHFNGTTDLCLPSTLNGSQDADNNNFFNNLVTGTDLGQYQQNVFQGAECTGCMYEMYKSAVYMISAIRGNSVTQAFGNHLQNDCQSKSGVNVDWSNVQDQQIPDALQVQQSTGATGAGVPRITLKWEEGVVGFGALLVGIWAVRRNVW